ncbi:MAG: hypothetical protein FJ276_18230 [Planctomycetes bacterium]|nr:hypothetical protein [Planctomycetota bacterium]
MRVIMLTLLQLAARAASADGSEPGHLQPPQDAPIRAVVVTGVDVLGACQRHRRQFPAIAVAQDTQAEKIESRVSHQSLPYSQSPFGPPQSSSCPDPPWASIGGRIDWSLCVMGRE